MGRKGVAANSADEAARPGDEEMMEEPARVAGAAQPAGEGCVVVTVTPLRHQPAEDAVAAQHGEDLAGHRGGEGGYPSVAHSHPFAVRTGQADRRLAGRNLGERADDLRLFAAHDIGDTGGVPVADTGRDPGASPPAPPDRLHSSRDLGDAGRAFDIGDLAPALAAADHAAHDDRHVVDPIAELRLEYAGEATTGDCHDAARRLAAGTNWALHREPVRAQGRCAPIN